MNGLEFKVEYAWAKQPNGKFVIFGVPFFRTFSDPHRGELGIEGLRKAMEVAEIQKKEGHFPRVFIGHHTGGLDNRPGVGFMDNFQLNGDTLFTDILEIDESRFQEIYNDEFPYRSCEFLPESNRITGLALLKSHEPYFIFPLLHLERKEKILTNVEKYSIRDRILKFSSGGKKMAFEDEKTDCEKAEDKKYLAGEEKTEEDSTKMKCATESEYADMTSKLDSLIAKLDSLIELITKQSELLQTLMSEEAEEHEEMGKGEGGAPEAPGKPDNESSVAYQLKTVNKRIQKLEGGINNSKYDAVLQDYCESTGQNFSALKETVRKFSSDYDRENFVNILKSSVLKFSAHPMTSHLSQFANTAINQKEKLVQKFSAQDPRMAKIARDAVQTYIDTTSHPDRRVSQQFAQIWPNVEKFVEHVVENEKLSPGYLERLTSPL